MSCWTEGRSNIPVGTLIFLSFDNMIAGLFYHPNQPSFSHGERNDGLVMGVFDNDLWR